MVHDRNLAGWTAEADEPKLEPEPEGLGEGDRGWSFEHKDLRSYVSRNWSRLFV
jgi:hypothetical protein